MRLTLLASAGVAVLALAAALSPASAEDCGCRDKVRAALSRQAPAMPRPAVSRRPATQGYAEAGYDYRAAAAVDMGAYRHRWAAAPQGYVPPDDGYDSQANAGYGPPMAYGPQVPYGQYYGDGWAYDYRPAITIDQDGWFGGVGYPQPGGDGGGGGGGGGVLTLAQPDSLNGPSYNSFNQAYGGAYGAANQNNAWRAEAFAPKASK